jgi:hypothetical protein
LRLQRYALFLNLQIFEALFLRKSCFFIPPN